MIHDVVDPHFADLVDADSAVRKRAGGYAWVEGPVWHPTRHHLLFSDIPGDARHVLDESGAVEVARPTGFANGMTYDQALNLLVCVHATSSVVRYAADGTATSLATHYEGRELNSPNDLVVRCDGSIYFTDPTYGRMAAFGVGRQLEMGFQGVYRIPPAGGDLQLLVDRATFTEPNGLCFSPDESLLYVNDTEQANIRVFDVHADGTLHRGCIFVTGLRSDDDPGLADGMKCDELGNVWVTAPGGVWVFAPDGRRLGALRCPERVANLAWGGRDGRTLFLTASSSVYSIGTRVGPNPEPYLRAHSRGTAI